MKTLQTTRPAVGCSIRDWQLLSQIRDVRQTADTLN